jgi:hypothetical protein
MSKRPKTITPGQPAPPAKKLKRVQTYYKNDLDFVFKRPGDTAQPAQGYYERDKPTKS